MISLEMSFIVLLKLSPAVPAVVNWTETYWTVASYKKVEAFYRLTNHLKLTHSYQLTWSLHTPPFFKSSHLGLISLSKGSALPFEMGLFRFLELILRFLRLDLFYFPAPTLTNDFSSANISLSISILSSSVVYFVLRYSAAVIISLK